MPNDDAGLAGALALHKAGKAAEAEAAYRDVLRAEPKQAGALAMLGALRLQAGDAAAAAQYLAQSLALDPDQPLTHNNHGVALQGLRQAAEALAAFDRAVALKPDFSDAHNNRGNALRNLRRHAEALDAYAEALKLKPDFARAHYNRGIALQELLRHDEAYAAFDRATALAPDYGDAWWSKAYIKLLTGDFAAGWPLYEWRWKRSDANAPRHDFPQSAWQGYADLKDKTILLYAEQGLGDTIQFCRYAKKAAALGARVILEVQPSLKTLMQSLDGVTTVVAQGEDIPPFDFVCPLASLPLAFKTDAADIPSDTPYLKAPAERIAYWGHKLGEKRAPRIGIVWSGNPKHKNDHNRSMMLWDFVPLAASGVELFSLQKDVSTADKVILAATPAIRDIGSVFTDFADCAAAMHHMDVVISVDTSAAHLAGALGKTVWILLPYAPEWRWLLDREDSPWYPTARLFRQPKMGDWRHVMDVVSASLFRLRDEKPDFSPLTLRGEAHAKRQNINVSN